MVPSGGTSVPLQNVKMEHANISFPVLAPAVPPGFPPKTSHPVAVESSGNRNPASTEIGFPRMQGQRQRSDFSLPLCQRRSPRKRSQPMFYRPPCPRRPAAAVAGARRRGRPPKANRRAQTSNVNEIPSDTFVQTTMRQGPEDNNPMGQETNMNGNMRNEQARTIEDILIDNNLACMIKAIKEKHGDITQDCSLESDCMKNLVLIGIGKVVQDLQKKQLEDFEDVSSLDAHYTTVRDGENMKINVRWLRDRLDEIKNAVYLWKQAKNIKNKTTRLLEEIVRVRRGLEIIKSQVQDFEEKLNRDEVIAVELNKKSDDNMLVISALQQDLLVGLL